MGELPSLNLGSSVLFIESDTGMAWTPMDIAIIAGELSRDPSSNQEGQRKCPGKKPPEDSGKGTGYGQCFPSLRGGFEM